jgi:hypothetical protein
MEFTMSNLSEILRLGVTYGILVIGVTSAKLVVAEPGIPEIPFLEEWQESNHAEGWKHSFLDREPALKQTKEGVVPKECARCHATAGFHDLLGLDGSEAGTIEKDAIEDNGISCIACHNELTLELEEVTFPSGESVEVLTKDARCMTCHQGRNSTTSVNETLEAAGVDDDEVSATLEYMDSHFLPAATRFGGEAMGGYQYDDLEYEEYYIHDEEATLCYDCHSLHTEEVEVSSCDSCHRKVSDPKDYKKVRKTKTDFDGDGDVTEGIAFEIRALQKKLYGAIMSYSKSIAGHGMVYDAKSYPYFFNDTNDNGKLDEGESALDNKYSHWTPRLVKAAYNFQYLVNEPGAYVHNPFYSLQLLYDSMSDLSTKVSVDMDKIARPE